VHVSRHLRVSTMSAAERSPVAGERDSRMPVRGKVTAFRGDPRRPNARMRRREIWFTGSPPCRIMRSRMSRFSAPELREPMSRFSTAELRKFRDTSRCSACVHYFGCQLWLSLLLMNEELSAPGLDLIVPDITRACPMFFPWSSASAQKPHSGPPASS